MGVGAQYFGPYMFMYIGAQVTAALLAGVFHRFHLHCHDRVNYHTLAEPKLIH
jgi:hypothetical protein